MIEETLISEIQECKPGQERLNLRLILADHYNQFGDWRGELIEICILDSSEDRTKEFVNILKEAHDNGIEMEDIKAYMDSVKLWFLDLQEDKNNA